MTYSVKGREPKWKVETVDNLDLACLACKLDNVYYAVEAVLCPSP
jgi:hypothetical protein